MDAATWSAVTTVDNDRGAVTVLPYCFFRSRGCPHLAADFDDRVLFHHEFDTAWRASYWHNYLEEDPPKVLGTDTIPRMDEWSRIDKRTPQWEAEKAKPATADEF